MAKPTHQLAAIMFTDIVGYTALMGKDEAYAFEVLSKFKDIATPLVRKYEGKWHKDLGDGALYSFGSALEAVKCATELQQQHNKESDVNVRIGIHLGDVTFQNGDVFGDGVNVASRLQSEAAPGGICLSEAVYMNVRNKEAINAEFLGKRKLKNVEGLAPLYQISTLGVKVRTMAPVKVIALWKATLFGVGFAILSGFASWYLGNVREPVEEGVERYEINLPPETPVALIGSTPLGIGQTAIAISPNGNLLVYAGQETQTTRLFLRPIDSYEVEVLKGTEGAYYPFFSPKGDWIAYFSGNYLKKVSVDGGEPITICRASNPMGGVWTSDDRIIFSDNEGGNLVWTYSSEDQLHKIETEGNSEVFSFNFPSLLGDNHLLVSSFMPKGFKAVSLEDGKQTRILNQGSCPRYLSSGHISFVVHGRLMVVPFDLETMTIKGNVVSIIDDLRTEEDAGQVAFSDEGTVIYIQGISAQENELVFRSMDGFEEVLTLRSDFYGTFKISPDGDKIVISNLSTWDLNVYDTKSQTMTRVTNDGGNYGGIWTPDGNQITYSHSIEDQRKMLQVNASGSGKPIEIMSNNSRISPDDWTSDQKVLMYTKSDSITLADIIFVFVNEDREDITLMPNRANQYLATFSPKDNFVAYTSNESGQSEVYVQPFPPDGNRWTISSDGGEEPLWSPSGDRLYYRNENNWLEVPITTSPTFSAGTPRLMFSGSYTNVPGYSYDISPDGKRFLLSRSITSKRTATRIKVIKNWFEEVKQRAHTE